MERPLSLLLITLLAVSGCSDSEYPLFGEGHRTNVAGEPAVATVQSVTFSDDFEAGLDPAVWYREVLANGLWIHATEAGNGYIVSPPANVWNWNNRFDDVLTHRDDFTDFTFTWDMRFHNQSWHQDYRDIYFRSDDAYNPHGYIVQVGVWIPTIPDNVLQIYRHNPDGTAVLLHAAYVSYPWTLHEWYSFKLAVSGSQFNLKVWKRSDPEPTDWTIEAVDPDGMYGSGRIGFGDYWNAITDVDNVVVTTPVTTVGLDVKPGSCPNPLRVQDPSNNVGVKNRAVLPVALLGSPDVSVEDIDVSSLLLEGIAPIRHAYEDVASSAGGESCACTTSGADGYVDLTLKFDAADVAAALGPVVDGETVPLQMTGRLLDGTALAGDDCVLIILKPRAPTPIETGQADSR